MNKRVVFVIAPQDFRDEELFVPAKPLKDEGVEVRVASTKTGLCQGADGGEVESELKIDEIKTDNFDAIFFIGGPGMEDLIDNLKLHSLAKDFYKSKKLVGAICIAPLLLAKAGLLEGISATSWSGVQSKISQLGADVVDKPVVVAGRVITAEGPDAAREFGKQIIKHLKED